MKKIFLNIYIIINVFIKIFSSEKLLKIPFKLFHTSHFYQENPDILSNKYMSQLIIELSIGKPSQKLNVSLDLNDNFYSYFLGNNLPNINFSILYNKSLSNTYKCEKEKEIFTIELFNKAEIFSDNVNFSSDDKNIEKNLKFLLINDLYKSIYTPGLIGLALKRDDRQLEENSFLYQLKKNNLISSEVFYFNFENDKSGKLIIGENIFNNENYLKIKVGYISSLSSKLLWSFNFDSIYYGDSKNIGTGDGIIELGHGLIIGTSTYEELIKSFFMKEKNCFLNYTNIGNLNLKYFWCEKENDIENKIEELNFELKSINYNFTLNGKDLFFQENNKKFFKILFLFDLNLKYWYLGLDFLQKFNIRFDHERKLLYIPLKENIDNNGENKNNKIANDDFALLSLVKKWQFWLCFFLIIIIIGLILYVIIYIKKYPKKKPVYELDDTDEYYDYKIKENLSNNNIN